MSELLNRILPFIKLKLRTFPRKLFSHEKRLVQNMSAPETDGVPLGLPAALNIKNILASRDLITDALEANGSILLDIPDDAQVDLSFVQLVLAARARAGGSVGLVRPASGELLDVLKRGGFLEGMSAEAAHFWLHQEKV